MTIIVINTIVLKLVLNKFICYVVTYAYAHAPSREDTRIVKGEYRGERGGEGECRGERETGKGKMEECRL